MMKRFEEFVATLSEPTQQELRIQAQIEEALTSGALAPPVQSDPNSIRRSNGRRYKVNEKGQMERVR